MKMNNNAKTVRTLLIIVLSLMLAVMPVLSGCGKKSSDAQEETTASLPTEAAETQQTTTATQTTTTTQETRTQETTWTTTAAQTPRADYQFRKYSMLESHYYKHGIDMGFDSPEEYLAAANAVIANPDALTKTEKEDGDTVFYVEATNEFVVLSTDGYIRTYFLPDGGKRYFDRQ